jgi:hypothetical protein
VMAGYSELFGRRAFSLLADLPMNPMSLRECVVCGEFFSREESRKHTEIWCQPSQLQPLAVAGRYC